MACPGPHGDHVPLLFGQGRIDVQHEGDVSPNPIVMRAMLSMGWTVPGDGANGLLASRIVTAPLRRRRLAAPSPRLQQ